MKLSFWGVSAHVQGLLLLVSGRVTSWCVKLLPSSYMFFFLRQVVGPPRGEGLIGGTMCQSMDQLLGGFFYVKNASGRVGNLGKNMDLGRVNFPGCLV